jgi:hypothetical protein
MVSVRLLIEQTPIAEVPIRIESESSNASTPIPRTNEEGIASQIVEGNDTVTISSGIEAIRFDPISGVASTLAGMSPIDIPEAERLIEPGEMCRRSVVAQQEEILFPWSNSADAALTVENADPLNIIVRGDEVPTTTQAPGAFAKGPGMFVVPLREFAVSPSETGGAWKFLGVTNEFSFNPLIEDHPLRLCEGKGFLPCRSLALTPGQILLKTTTRYHKRLLDLEKQLKRKYPLQNKKFTFRRDRNRSYKKINEIMTSLRAQSLRCAEDLGNCRQLRVPKEQLSKIFFSGWRPRPPRGRVEFRRLRARGQADFDAVVQTLPEFIVTCA